MAQALRYPHFVRPHFPVGLRETSPPPPYPAASPGQLSDDVDQPALIRWMSSCTSLRVGDDPPSLIPIQPKGADSSSCQLWLGDDRDNQLLTSEQSVLLEVRDFSRLVFDGDASADAVEKLRELEGNVKILVPYRVANSVGFSNMTSVGPVTQYTSSGTFILKKISTPEECAPYETIVYEKDAVFSLLRIPPEVEPELEAEWDRSDDAEEPDEKFSLSKLPDMVRWSMEEMMSRRRILTATGIRFVFCWLTYYLNVIGYGLKGQLTSGQLGVRSWNTYASRLAGMRQSVCEFLSTIATRVGNFF